MMSGEQIHAVSDAAAVQAAEEEQRPFVYWDIAEVDSRQSFPFPNLGDYVPRGWVTVGDRYFCDSSGFGALDEPAMTACQLRSEIKRRIAASPSALGWAVVEVGQFQLYVQAYRRV